MGTVWKAQDCNDAATAQQESWPQLTLSEYLLSPLSKPKDNQLDSSHFQWQLLYDSKANWSENTLTSSQMTCRQRFGSSIAKQHMKSHFCLS